MNGGGFWNKDQALGLPPGSIQAIMALGLLFGTMITYLIYQWAPEALVVTMVAVVKDYFAAKAVDKAVVAVKNGGSNGTATNGSAAGGGSGGSAVPPPAEG